jgi:hypothetical protein
MRLPLQLGATYCFIRKNVVHFDHIFMITMQPMSKLTYFTTNNVLVLCVHVVATCCNHICNYRKHLTKL